MSLKRNLNALTQKRGNKDFSLAWRDESAAVSNVKLSFRIGNVRASTFFTSDPSLPSSVTQKAAALPGDSYRPEE